MTYTRYRDDQCGFVRYRVMDDLGNLTAEPFTLVNFGRSGSGNPLSPLPNFIVLPVKWFQFDHSLPAHQNLREIVYQSTVNGLGKCGKTLGASTATSASNLPFP